MVFENVEVGKEQPPIEAKRVNVIDYTEQDVKDREGKEVGTKLVLKVKHPDIPEIEISKAKYEKNKKLTESGLWLGKDKDNRLPFNSAVAHLLRFYNCRTISDMKGKDIDTVTDEGGFIIAKAY